MSGAMISEEEEKHREEQANQLLTRTGIKGYILESSDPKKGCQIKACNLKKHLTFLGASPRKVFDVVEAAITLVSSRGGKRDYVRYDDKNFTISPDGVSIIGSYQPPVTKKAYPSLRF